MRLKPSSSIVNLDAPAETRGDIFFEWLAGGDRMSGKVWFGGSRRSGGQRRSGCATGRRLALAFELLERRLLLAASPPDWLSGWSDEAVANEQATQFTFPTYTLPDALLNDISTTHFLGVLTNVEPAIVVGDPNGSPAGSLSDRVDPNVPTSAFAGVVSVRSVVVTDEGTSIGTCTGTLISAAHVLTAAHGGLNYDSGDGADSLATFTYFNATDGSVLLDVDGDNATTFTISYAGLEPIASAIASSVVEWVYTGGDETIAIGNARRGKTSMTQTAKSDK